MPAVPPNMITTQFELPGYEVERSLGVVVGVFMRSISVFGTFTNQCEKSRADAIERMLQHAGDLGANAMVGVRFDSIAVNQEQTEILAYGTAVLVQPKRG